MLIIRMARLSALALLFLLGVPAASDAVVGTVDTNDEFPFVVRLETEYSDGLRSWCSGVVHGHILSTAAHCLYKSDAGDGQGLAVKVTVQYVDTVGIRQTAVSRKLFVPPSYIEADARHHQDYKGAIHDIGYVVLDQDVLVNGYIHWGLELLKGIPDGKFDCAEPECMDWSLTGARRDALLENLRKEVGSLSEAKVRIIGYGNYKCVDYDNRENNCVSDGQRRFVQLQLKPDLTSPSAPWLWCTGRGDVGTNPVQHGDSGGPVFVQALDGRWLYVGYTSRGSNEDGCASSMFNDLNLWRSAIAAYDTMQVKGLLRELSDEAVEAWHESISRQFFREWLRNESAAAQIALDHLRLLYTALSPELAPQFMKGFLDTPHFDYHGRKSSFNDIVRDKKQYFERWPERAYSVPSDISVECDEHELHNGDTCTVSAALDWMVRNGDRRLSGRSNFALMLDMPYFFSKSLLLLQFAPAVRGENGTVRSKGDRSAVGQTLMPQQVKQNVSSGYVNLRAGPGQDQRILAQIPAGARITVSPTGCVQPSDGVSRYPFCPVIWHGRKGWLSASGLE